MVCVLSKIKEIEEQPFAHKMRLNRNSSHTMRHEAATHFAVPWMRSEMTVCEKQINPNLAVLPHFTSVRGSSRQADRG